jgi:hypothetical protein
LLLRSVSPWNRCDPLASCDPFKACQVRLSAAVEAHEETCSARTLLPAKRGGATAPDQSPAVQAKELLVCAPTVSNLSVATLRAKMATLRVGLAHWDLTPSDLSTGSVALALMSSQQRLLRLSHCAASRVGTGGSGRALKPSTLLNMSAARFEERYPSFQRWLRRHGHTPAARPGSSALLATLDSM